MRSSRCRHGILSMKPLSRERQVVEHLALYRAARREASVAQAPNDNAHASTWQDPAALHLQATLGSEAGSEWHRPPRCGLERRPTNQNLPQWRGRRQSWESSTRWDVPGLV